jgi:predicted PurR-regulated permease PerM
MNMIQTMRWQYRFSSAIASLYTTVLIAGLCTATIRAVALGVVGIAFIQMLLISVGFVVMGIPGAGLLALAVLLIGIIQLPATLVTIPVIAFAFATKGASTATIVFALCLRCRPGGQRTQATAVGARCRCADAGGAWLRVTTRT